MVMAVSRGQNMVELDDPDLVDADPDLSMASDKPENRVYCTERHLRIGALLHREHDRVERDFSVLRMDNAAGTQTWYQVINWAVVLGSLSVGTEVTEIRNVENVRQRIFQAVANEELFTSSAISRMHPTIQFDETTPVVASLLRREGFHWSAPGVPLWSEHFSSMEMCTWSELRTELALCTPSWS